MTLGVVAYRGIPSTPEEKDLFDGCLEAARAYLSDSDALLTDRIGDDGTPYLTVDGEEMILEAEVDPPIRTQLINNVGARFKVTLIRQGRQDFFSGVTGIGLIVLRKGDVYGVIPEVVWDMALHMESRPYSTKTSVAFAANQDLKARIEAAERAETAKK